MGKAGGSPLLQANHRWVEEEESEATPLFTHVLRLLVGGGKRDTSWAIHCGVAPQRFVTINCKVKHMESTKLSLGFPPR